MRFAIREITSSPMGSSQFIQREVQPQQIDGRLSDHARVRWFGQPLNECADLRRAFCIEMAFRRKAIDLGQRVRDADERFTVA